MSVNKKLIILLLVLSAVTHFAFFGHPNQTVFDEVHFGKFISGYLTGEYFFDIHPPLGKLLISGLGYLTGFKPGFSFAAIGETFSDHHYLWLRLLPTLAGTLLPLIIFLLALELSFSNRSAFLAGFFVIFENALNIQSRFILLDSFLLLFGFSALLFYLKYRHQNFNSKWLTWSGVMAGLAASVKWTGLAFLAIILLFELIRLGQSGRRIADWLKAFLGFILIPLAIYVSIFAIHFHLLTKSGTGDAFMSREFQKTLTGNPNENNLEIKEIDFVEKFKEVNKQMYQANERITATHPYGSKWYTWPFLNRTVFYWQKDIGTQQEKIYLLGNPLIWWAGTIAMLFLLIHCLQNLFQKIKGSTLDPEPLPTASYGAGLQKGRTLGFVESFLLLGFFINLLPFIGIKRVMFLYHYFPSLIFTLLTLAYLSERQKKGFFTFLIIIAVAGFLYFSPFTYGLPLSTQAQNYLLWSNSWR